jgi:hypothetical protein
MSGVTQSIVLQRILVAIDPIAKSPTPNSALLRIGPKFLQCG